MDSFQPYGKEHISPLCFKRATCFRKLPFTIRINRTENISTALDTKEKTRFLGNNSFSQLFAVPFFSS